MYKVYASLDPIIGPLVYLLREQGFNTYSSCDGGDGHAYLHPTVLIIPQDWQNMQPEIDRLAEVLVTNGYRTFFLKQSVAYADDRLPWNNARLGPLHLIELEFWGEPINEEGYELSTGTSPKRYQGRQARTRRRNLRGRIQISMSGLRRRR